MVIDFILDRKAGSPYKAEDFYRYAMAESECFDGLFDGLTRAMDYGEEEDVRRELNAYIKNQGYDAESLCEYVDSVKWLEDDPEKPTFTTFELMEELKKMGYFATCLWNDEDLENYLHDYCETAGEEYSEEKLEELKELARNEAEDIEDRMCQAGYEYIMNMIPDLF